MGEELKEEPIRKKERVKKVKRGEISLFLTKILNGKI